MISKEQQQFLEFILDKHISRLQPDFRKKLISIFSVSDDVRFLSGLTNKKKHYVLQVLRKHIGATTLASGTSITSKKYYEIRGWNSDESISLAKKVLEQRNNKKSPYNYLTWVELGKSVEEAHLEVKSRRPFNKEFWIKKGFSEAEAKNKITSLQKRLSDKGNNNFSDGRTSTQFQYWIKKGFSNEDALNKLSQRQKSASLIALVKKYGVRKGILQVLRRKSVSISTRRDILTAYRICDKTVNGFILAQKVIKKNKRGHASKESLRLFEPFYFASKEEYDVKIGSYGLLELKIEYFDENNKKRFYRYDFAVMNFKVIIEYDGWYYHTPNKEGGAKPKNGKDYCAKLELEKQTLAEKHGFTVYRISNLNSFEDNIQKIYEVLVKSGVKLQYEVLSKYSKHKKALESIRKH